MDSNANLSNKTKTLVALSTFTLPTNHKKKEPLITFDLINCFRELITNIQYKEFKKEKSNFVFTYRDAINTLKSKYFINKDETIEIFLLMIEKGWIESINNKKESNFKLTQKSFELRGVKILLDFLSTNDSGTSAIFLLFTKMLNTIQITVESINIFKNPLKKVSGKDIIDWISKELETSREDSLELATQMFNKKFFIHLKFMNHVVDRADEYYALSYPSKLDNFIISKRFKKHVNKNLFYRHAVLIETMSDMTLYYIDIKESKKWSTSFEIWREIYHPNHVGIHLQFKLENTMIFAEDKMYVDLIKLLRDNSKTGNCFRPKNSSGVENLYVTYNENFVKTIAKSVLNFFFHLHLQGMVYGNLSFENIVMTSPKNVSVKTSFSISRYRTRTSIVFCAPEVLATGKYSPASDLWNLGVILYVLLFGKYPFSLDSEEILKSEILQKKISFPNEAIHVSTKSKEFLVKLFEKDPKERAKAVECLNHPWIKTSFNSTFEIYEGIFSTENENLYDFNVKESLEEKKWFTIVCAQISKVAEQLSQLRFNKKIPSTLSVISEFLFSQKIITRELKSNLEKFILTNQSTQFESLTILLVGPPKSGKNVFVEKLMGIYKIQNVKPDERYVNGCIMKVFNFQIDGVILRFITLNFPTKNNLSFFYDFTETQKQETLDDLFDTKSLGDIFGSRKKTLVSVSSSEESRLKFHNSHSGDLFLSEGSETEIKVVETSPRGIIPPKYMRVLGIESTESSSRDSFSSQKNIPKYMRLLGIENQSVLEEEQFLSSEPDTVFKHKPFSWMDIDWTSEIAELDAVLYFSDCRNYVDDKTVDEYSLDNFKKVLNSKFLTNQKSIYGNVPISVVVNKTDCKPLLSQKLVENQFYQVLPQNTKEIYFEIFFGNCNSESFIKDVYNTVSKKESKFQKFSDLPNCFKSLPRERQNIFLYRNTHFFKNLEPPVFKAVTAKHLKHLEIVNSPKFFKAKTMNLLISQIKECSLEQLIFCGGTFTSETLDQFCDLLKKSELRLRYIKLINMDLKDKSFINIIRALSFQQKLISVDLSRNRLNEDCLKQLEELFINVKSLSQVFISCCGLNEQQLRKFLLKLLKMNSFIETLDISGNVVSSDLILEIIALMKKYFNQSLSNFSFSLQQSDPTIIDTVNQLLARNRRVVTRKSVSKKISDGKTENLKILEKFFPFDFFSILFLSKIFEDMSKSNEDFLCLREKCLNLMENKPKIDEKMKDDEDHILNYFQQEYSSEKSEFKRLDLSWFFFLNENIEKHINVESLGNLNILDLSGNKLTEIPKEVFNLKSLKTLNVSSNRIESIPNEISKLKVLSVLDIRKNRLSSLNFEVSKLENLNILNLHNNQIHHIKVGILGNLQNLEVLTLHNNFLDSIPNDLFEKVTTIKELTACGNLFYYLKQLCYEMWGNRETKANLSSLEIEHLPFEIYLLKDVTELDMSNNKLKYLPPHISYLTNLKRLDLRNNTLIELPPQMSSILPNLDLYISGNINLKLPKDFLIESNKPVSKNQIPSLIQFLDGFNKMEYQKKNLHIHVLVDNEEDFYSFTKQMFSSEITKNSFPNLFQNSDFFKSKKFKINAYDSNQKDSPNLEIKNMTPRRDSFTESKSGSQNPMKSSSDDSSFEIYKNVLPPKENKDKDKDKWYAEVKISDNLKAKITGFENMQIFTHYFSLFSEYSNTFYVIISSIDSSVTKFCSKILPIRAVNKKPVIVLGNNPDNYEKKSRKTLEINLQKKLSKLYSNISGAFFISNENSKDFNSLILKLYQQIPKISYKEIQLEYMIECESKFLYPFTIIKTAEMNKMIEGCKFEQNFRHDKILEKLHNGGSLIHFNKSVWGESKLILIEPRLLVSMIRHIIEYSQNTKGVLDISDCYCQFLMEYDILVFSPIWISLYIYFLKKIELIFEIEANPSILNQYKECIIKFDKNLKNDKVFVNCYKFPISPCDWSVVKDLWDTFSPKNYFDQNDNLDISQSMRRSSSLQLITSKNNIKNNKGEIEEEFSEDSEEGDEEMTIEKWYYLAVYPENFFNKILCQILSIPKIHPVRLWRDLGVFNFGKGLMFMIGIYQFESGKCFKFIIKGTNISKFFFILNDIFETTLKTSLKGIRVSSSYSVIPISGCGEDSIKMKLLEMAIYEKKDINCPTCMDNSIVHPINVSLLAPFLTLKHFQRYRVKTQHLQNRVEIGRGSAGIIYKATLLDEYHCECVVAVKELNLDKISESSIGNDDFTGLIESWRREANMLFLLKDRSHIIEAKGYTIYPHSLIMEYAEFGDLSYFLKSEKSNSLSIHEKCKIGEDLASALNALHTFEPKIIHRDLKSLNILVTSLSPLTVKLSDFETACFMNEFTCGRSTIDNPIWMAPELILGTRYTEKVDIYSLGIVMWEIETRKIPFEESDFFSSELEKEICFNCLRPYIENEKENAWDENYLSLMKACWSENPFSRPNAEQVAKELKKIREGKVEDLCLSETSSNVLTEEYQHKKFSSLDIRKLIQNKSNVPQARRKSSYRPKVPFTDENRDRKPLNFSENHIFHRKSSADLFEMGVNDSEDDTSATILDMNDFITKANTSLSDRFY